MLEVETLVHDDMRDPLCPFIRTNGAILERFLDPQSAGCVRLIIRKEDCGNVS